MSGRLLRFRAAISLYIVDYIKQTRHLFDYLVMQFSKKKMKETLNNM